MIDTTRIERNGKVMILAYDQGFEHGPVDFDEKSVDPAYIMEIAKNGYFTGVVFQEGVAAKYYQKESGVPLIVKLNGKTSFQGEEPLSLQLCTVEKAAELGAVGVGYTIYVGSENEERMMVEFSKIEDEAHARGMIVIAWMYPRGRKVAGREADRDVVAYGARIGMELNADFVKVPYTGDVESFEWVVRAAGKTGVLAQGGKKVDWENLDLEIGGAMKAGAKGIAIGRNVWQDKYPNDISKKLSEIVFK
ncbi:MAG: fructose-bisphosphate aldolase (class I), fructose-bisphosphate aldolase, class I [Microgenomates group bacterium GW2011_GWC1_44_37]|uniref:fructose-bisphosphate aldolase n=1 Tax=Candidatus Collierbacteria bacterium GW2011_GWB2_44_22 TaxID=1618387 RepID=A0A0G1HXT9_9BACT|nr:MAG: Fructose-bisphosphate aldolase (Class I) [Candidatus Collierbacteria bacterium GW2011_GWB2_44_22]KKT61186.1 MAG: Fructose-bisphosphate aldolase (Class I) [Candidatus Collierbacteria bacterium GW2011_GWD1_44_27]KKT68276.1 MAG: fructose-bisphosphate aldolase (class I), fructose-bisphosphate aldolase, class I [Microgenomates group bacterium GW2011_GWC1_44_37]KKT88363.1 MAG: Fructose-bisphosphate aldolase (Class I) [Candidatus Collierbacteria bacterium GW2011_GWD2_45_10]